MLTRPGIGSMKLESNPRKDFTQIAFDVARKATGEVEPSEPANPKKKAAQESGRRGGLKGGSIRAKKLNPERRAEIAKLAALARWKKQTTEQGEGGKLRAMKKLKVFV